MGIAVRGIVAGQSVFGGCLYSLLTFYVIHCEKEEVKSGTIGGTKRVKGETSVTELSTEDLQVRSPQFLFAKVRGLGFANRP